MILIISAGIDDSTSNVIEWLIYQKKNFFRINEVDRIAAVNINMESGACEISVRNTLIDISKVQSYWFRRGGLAFAVGLKTEYESDVSSQLYEQIRTEYPVIREFLSFSLNQLRHINTLELGNINKLIVLKQAEKVGLTIPLTLVTNRKKQALQFVEKHNGTITKTINMPLLIFGEGININGFTMEVTPADVQKKNDAFYISKIQNLVNKKFEIRSFFLIDKFYSMAIFSQEDEQTKVDFRKYNEVKPNRRVPFRLPERIEEMLKNLMQQLGLNSGSIDMIYTRESEYVFLEVNPVGQYGMVSDACNYNLDKEIANYL
jgi:ATP-GRASP peptide maturase of grasp-with-spasm system